MKHLGSSFKKTMNPYISHRPKIQSIEIMKFKKKLALIYEFGWLFDESE